MASDFNTISQILIDNWLSMPDMAAEPEALYRGILSSLNVKMAISRLDTRADNPYDWHYRSIRKLGIKTKILDFAKALPDGRLGDVADQAYISEAMIPPFTRVLKIKGPVIDRVQARIIGVNIGYDRIILPQKSSGKPEWCMSFTEGRFLLAAPKENASLDNTDEGIVQLLIEGQTAKEIAVVLNISSRTVEHRIEKMKVRYEARNLVHLTAKLIATYVDRQMVQGKAPRETA